jgi:hypothetical protein
MPDPAESLPAFVRDLYERAGPILRYRIQRDVLGRDLSHIIVAQMAKDVAALPRAQERLLAQQSNGLWGNFLHTFDAFQRLCEYGLEEHDQLLRCRDEVLFPTLLRDDVLWELEAFVHNDRERAAARQVVRDMTLHMLSRSKREPDLLLKSHLERVLAEWGYYIATGPHREWSGVPIPTIYAWPAVACYPWSDEELERVREVVLKLDAFIEKKQPEPPKETPEVLETIALRDAAKELFLSQPWQLFYSLEMAARLGMVRDLGWAGWLMSEMEAHQDGDGFFRFDAAPPDEPLYFFPIEETDPARYEIEYTFHAHHIYKLLEYDF